MFQIDRMVTDNEVSECIRLVNHARKILLIAMRDCPDQIHGVEVALNVRVALLNALVDAHFKQHGGFHYDFA